MFRRRADRFKRTRLLAWVGLLSGLDIIAADLARRRALFDAIIRMTT
ncbi:hypothetical protein HMPREF1255_0468 [Propionimicrobium sp. BV2F7]|nr:hypothetical protein HMPREF1255_0468 [Propionimicrobium sp. BV2F7]